MKEQLEIWNEPTVTEYSIKYVDWLKPGVWNADETENIEKLVPFKAFMLFMFMSHDMDKTGRVVFEPKEYLRAFPFPGIMIYHYLVRLLNAKIIECDGVDEGLGCYRICEKYLPDHKQRYKYEQWKRGEREQTVCIED